MKFRRVYIEITNVCNLACSFCPPVERAKRVITPAQFDKTLDEVLPLTDEIALHLMGEPLGHPRFRDFIRRCGEKGVRVFLVTNGTFFREELHDTLLDPVIRQVNVSLHSFAANFPGTSPDEYLARVFALTRAALARRPDLYVNLRLWDLACATSFTAENTALREGVEREFGISLDARAIDVRRRKNLQLSGRIYLHFDSRFVWPSPREPVRAQKGFCHGLSSHVAIHTDGAVVPCCLDKEAVIRLGNIHETPLTEILASPRAEAMRAGFRRGELVEDLCRRCDFAKRFDRKSKTSI